MLQLSRFKAEQDVFWRHSDRAGHTKAALLYRPGWLHVPPHPQLHAQPKTTDTIRLSLLGPAYC